MALTAGTKLRTSNLAGVVARAVRTTISTGSTSTTDIPVLSLSNILMLSGQEYSIRTSCLAPNGGATDVARVQIRYNTSGSTASISDPILPGGQGFGIGNGSGFTPLTLDCEYIPGSTQVVSLLLCVARSSGSGTVTLYADGTRTIELKVIANGLSVLDTGSGNTL